VIALRAPLYLELGIATALLTGAYLAQSSPPQPSAPALAVADTADDESLDIRTQSTERSCDADAISTLVIRGQFTSLDHQHEGFAISFAGTNGRYTAFTDQRGYFEVRIPRDDFAGDLCELPPSARSFRDDQMTLSYRIDFE
jgi:hypothetical protein